MLRYILTLLALITITSPHAKAETPLDTTRYQEQGYNAITSLEKPSEEIALIFDHLLTETTESIEYAAENAWLRGALEALTFEAEEKIQNITYSPTIPQIPEILTLETTVSHIKTIFAMTYQHADLSCDYVKREPRFYTTSSDTDITSAHFGYMSTPPPISFQCSNDDLPLPASLIAYNKLTEHLGYRYQQCGSMALMHGRIYNSRQTSLQFSLYGLSIPDSHNYNRPDEFLAYWELFSAWNYRFAAEIREARNQAIDDISSIYLNIATYNLTPEQARNAAINSIRYYRQPPPPIDNINYAILNNGSLEEIEIAWQNRIIDTSYDETIQRYFETRDFRFIGAPESPLLVSVFRPEVTAWLLDQGEDIEQTNRIGKTVLMTAAHLDQLETVILLLERGANVNNISKSPNEIIGNPVTIDGQTIIVGHDYIRNEIRNGRYGYREFYQACDRTSPIITHGNRTALMYAAENASAAVINILLEHGADICLADSEGLTALDYFSGKAPSGDTNNLISESERIELTEKLTCNQ